MLVLLDCGRGIPDADKDRIARVLCLAWPYVQRAHLRKDTLSFLVEADIDEPSAVRKTAVELGAPKSRLRQVPAYLQRMDHQEAVERVRRLRLIAWMLQRELGTFSTPDNRAQAARFLETLAREMDPSRRAAWAKRLPPALAGMLTRRAKIYYSKAVAMQRMFPDRKKRS